MKWLIKDKETVVKTCFAILPKRIGYFRIWLQRYYKTYDWNNDPFYCGYIPHLFIDKEDAIKYIDSKFHIDNT